MKKENQIKAVMNVEKGEEIIGTWITPQIPQIGFYMLLAKKKKDGACEQVYFIQRLNGKKTAFFCGEGKSKDEIDNVVIAINNAPSKTFKIECKLKLSNPEVYSLDGKSLDNDVIY